MINNMKKLDIKNVIKKPNLNNQVKEGGKE